MNIKDIIVIIKNEGRCARNCMRTPEHRAQDEDQQVSCSVTLSLIPETGPFMEPE